MWITRLGTIPLYIAKISFLKKITFTRLMQVSGEKAQIHFLFSHNKSHTFHSLQGQRVNLFQIQSKSITNKGITINVEYGISFLSGRVESKPII